MGLSSRGVDQKNSGKETRLNKLTSPPKVGEKEVDIIERPLYAADCVAGWSSLVARRAHNPKVAGSNPAPAMSRLASHHCAARRFALHPAQNMIRGSSVARAGGC